MARFTPAVVRALDILELLGRSGNAPTAGDIVDLTGFPRTSVHELLGTLAARDYVRKANDGGYRLGIAAFHLGRGYAHHFDMLQDANEIARRVSAQCGETVSVALLEGAEVFYLAKAELDVQVPMASKIGLRLPASSTGLGKALLAGLSEEAVRRLYPDPNALPGLTSRSIATLDRLEWELAEVRRTGVAHEREESGRGICCSAAQVRDITGDVIAALRVSVPVERYDARPQSDWDRLVLEGAAELSRILGYKAER